MRSLKIVSVSAILGSVLFVTGGQGQQPTPMIIVQAANAAPSSTPAAARPATEASSAIEAATKALEQVKAANEETLKKQEAVLQQLDELQKAAEQLKVFSKRV